jgi:hypothetical protein
MQQAAATLDDDYYKKALSVVDEQLGRAGLRLAAESLAR